MAGYGENSRVLAWIFRRCEGISQTIKTPIGHVPAPGELELTDLHLPPDSVQHLLDVNRAELQAELPQITKHLEQFGDRLPVEIADQLRNLEAELAPPRNANATTPQPATSGRLTPTRTSTSTASGTHPR